MLEFAVCSLGVEIWKTKARTEESEREPPNTRTRTGSKVPENPVLVLNAQYIYRLCTQS